MGPRIGPRLLAELGDQMDHYADVHALQALAGTCPVPYASGNFHQDRARRSCKKPLRNVVQQLAQLVGAGFGRLGEIRVSTLTTEQVCSTVKAKLN